MLPPAPAALHVQAAPAVEWRPALLTTKLIVHHFSSAPKSIARPKIVPERAAPATVALAPMKLYVKTNRPERGVPHLTASCVDTHVCSSTKHIVCRRSQADLTRFCQGHPMPPHARSGGGLTFYSAGGWFIPGPTYAQCPTIFASLCPIQKPRQIRPTTSQNQVIEAGSAHASMLAVESPALSVHILLAAVPGE